MNNKTVKGLLITGIALLGASYATQKYILIRNKRVEAKNREKRKEENTVEINQHRNYYEIGKIVVENGESKVKSITAYQKAM